MFPSLVWALEVRNQTKMLYMTKREEINPWKVQVPRKKKTISERNSTHLCAELSSVLAWRRGVACLRLLERGEHTTKDCITKDLSTFVDYLAHLSRNNCLRSNLFHEVVTPSSSLESRNINALGSSWKCKFQSCFLWLGLLWYQLKCIWYHALIIFIEIYVSYKVFSTSNQGNFL